MSYGLFAAMVIGFTLLVMCADELYDTWKRRKR